MSFLSLRFILFIAVTFFAYFVVPKKYQWLVLLFFSYAYYYLNSGMLLLVLIGESLFTFVIGRMLSGINIRIKENDDKSVKEQFKNKSRVILLLSVTVILGLLVIIKYSNFIIDNINNLINGNISFIDLVLPLGVSFYTLQAISYLMDIYRNKIEACDNVLHFMLYMAYFPQIIQGPIPRYDRLFNQLVDIHHYDYDRVTKGLQLMFYGIAKKVIIADRIAVAVNHIFENYNDYHGIYILFGAICYSIQIYADFSGGIDAIRGISEVFGIELDHNFRQPYFSKSIEEFWRRWHISLGSFMKDYVFYPLSLSKGIKNISKKARKHFGTYFGKRIGPCIAMFIVYLLVGIWHGADWKYVVYGIWNGLFIMSGIMFEDTYKKMLSAFRIKDDNRLFNIFRMIRTFLICSTGRIFSRSNTLTAGLIMFKSLFTRLFDFRIDEKLLSSLGLNYKNWILLVMMCLIVMVIDYLKEKEVDVRNEIASKPIVVRWVLYYILIISILLFGLYGGGYDASTFIYGRF